MNDFVDADDFVNADDFVDAGDFAGSSVQRAGLRDATPASQRNS